MRYHLIQYELCNSVHYPVNFDDLALMMQNWLVDCALRPGDSACVPK